MKPYLSLNWKARPLYIKLANSRFTISSFFIIAFSILQSMMSGGCATQRLAVVPYHNQNTVVLNAKDVVAVMRRAGFYDEQIEQLGLEFRNALALHGACRIGSVDRTEALFLTEDNSIYVTVRGRGNFFYKIRKE